MFARQKLTQRKISNAQVASSRHQTSATTACVDSNLPRLQQALQKPQDGTGALPNSLRPSNACSIHRGIVKGRGRPKGCPRSRSGWGETPFDNRVGFPARGGSDAYTGHAGACLAARLNKYHGTNAKSARYWSHSSHLSIARADLGLQRAGPRDLPAGKPGQI